MDYVQSNNTGFGSAISSGSGSENPNINNSGDSLVAGEPYSAPEHNPRDIGSRANNVAISSSQEAQPNNIVTFPHPNLEPLQADSEASNPDRLGEIIPVMPPGIEEAAPDKNSETQKTNDFSGLSHRKGHIKDHISWKEIKHIAEAVEQNNNPKDIVYDKQEATKDFMKEVLGDGAYWKGGEAA